MVAVSYADVANLNPALVRKTLRGSAFLAPMTAPALTAATLFNTDGSLKTGALTAHKDGGTVTDDGFSFGRSTKSDTLTGFQFTDPVRDDLTEDTETIKTKFMETNALAISLYTGVDVTTGPLNTITGGVLTIDKPALPPVTYWRLLVLAYDTIGSDELYFGWHYPRVRVTDWDDQAFAKTGALQWGMTLTAYNDKTLGVSKRTFIGGKGFGSVATNMGFAISSGA